MGNKHEFFICFFLLIFYSSPLHFSSSYIPSIPDSQNWQNTANGISFNLVGQVGGPTQTVAVKDNYAYVGIGMRMVVLDVSNSSSIQQVGETSVFDGFVTGVFLNGNKAYVTAGAAGLYVIDISSPTQPSILGSDDTPGYAEHIFIKGSYAYVADGWSGLTIVDISDSTNPSEAGSLSTLGYAFDVVVADHTAYIAAAGAGLKVVDVQYPSGPIEIGEYNTPGYAFGIDFSDGVVYIADGWEGLQIIDVSDPSQPFSLDSTQTPGWAFGVSVEGSIVYVADAFKGLRLVDVSSPVFPSEIGAYEPGVKGHAGSVAIAGNKAFVADRYNGLRIIDISSTSNPSQIGFYSALGYAREAAVSGNYACVAGGPYGLRIVDVSDPSRPKEVGRYDTENFAMCVSLVGSYAYVATLMGETVGALHVIDISNPQSPKRVGLHLVNYPSAFRDMVVSGGMAYIANEWGLEVLNISNPTNPFLGGTIQFWDGGAGSATVGVDVSGTLAYVTQHQEGIKIVDVSDPGNLSLRGTFEDESSHSEDVTIVGDRAYVADSHIFRILDISNPANPSELGRIDSHGQAYEVEVDGNIAYVANGSSGVLAIDVSDPSNLSLIGEFNTPGFSYKLHKAGNMLYVADADAGLLILEIQQTTGSSQSNLSHTSTGQVNHPNSGIRSLPHGYVHRTLPERVKKQNSPLALPAVKNNFGPSTSWLVNTTVDSGGGSLREAMANAQNGDTITFDTSVFPPDNPATIILSDTLPYITQGNITIDASNAGVIIDGNNNPNVTCGFWIYSDGNVVRGFQIYNMPANGIEIFTGEENIIGGDRTKGDGPVGQGNVISGNGTMGINCGGKNNTIIGNLIGVDVSGMGQLGNGGCGVYIYNSTDNTIGGTNPGERNIISGNGLYGVGISRSGTSGNSVIGNYVGTDINGSYDLGNADDGVVIELGSYNNLVKGNLVNGSGSSGIKIVDWGSNYNTVVGNIVGLDASGQKALGNDQAGVAIGYYGASFNRVGGTSLEDRNVISGHSYSDGKYRAGIDIYGPSGRDNFIIGNFIGTDTTGTKAISNHTGVRISGADHNFIGGTTDEERNVISGNDREIDVDQGDYNYVAGNYIGISANGTSPLHGEYQGISIASKTYHNAIINNLIYGNPSIGLSGDENTLRGNTFTQSNRGLNVDGNSNLIHYKKFLNNQTQASDSGANSWDRNGTGNYWSDYTGSDADGDGIGDISYSIPDNGTDHYPLISDLNRLTVQINPSGSGSVTITPNKSSYKFGENVRLKAIPSGDKPFYFWSGGSPPGYENDNPLTVRMDSDRTITANFFRIIYPPLSFIGEKKLNRSLFQTEYFNELTWQANPNNEDIVKYRIYISNGQTILVELDASTLKYWHRGVEKDRSNNYAIVAVNSEGIEGTPASYVVQ